MTEEEEKEFVETWTNNFLKMYGVRETEDGRIVSEEEYEAEEKAKAAAKIKAEEKQEKEEKQTSQQNTTGGNKMKFCQNCGSQMQEGAKFCPNCGTPAGQVASAAANQSANDASARKQEYVGTIRKCPSCGAEVPSFAVTCPSCGHELNDAKVSDSLKKFQEGLIKYEGKQERDFVASFPIPNTREELGNFIFLVHSILITDLKNGADSQRVGAFTAKLKDIKNKIDLILPENDILKSQAKKCLDEVDANIFTYKKILTLNRQEAKRQRKIEFKQKHPFLNFWIKNTNLWLIIIGAWACWSCIELIKDNIKVRNAYTELQKVSETTKVFPKENVILPLKLQPYFDVASDCTLKIAEHTSAISIDVTLRCKKSIRADLDKNLAKKIADLGIRKTDYDVNQSYFISIFEGNDFSYSDIARIMANAKPNEEVIISIQEQKISYSKDLNLNELEQYLSIVSILKDDSIHLFEDIGFRYALNSKEEENGYSKYKYYVSFDE